MGDWAILEQTPEMSDFLFLLLSSVFTLSFSLSLSFLFSLRR